MAYANPKSRALAVPPPNGTRSASAANVPLGGLGRRRIEWSVKTTWSTSRGGFRGMWQAVQLSPLASRDDCDARQSEVWWQVIHLPLKYAAFSFAPGTVWGSWQVPHHSFSPLARLQVLCARFSAWLVTVINRVEPERTKTVRESASLPPARNERSSLPGFATRMSPER